MTILMNLFLVLFCRPRFHSSTRDMRMLSLTLSCRALCEDLSTILVIKQVSVCLVLLSQCRLLWRVLVRSCTGRGFSYPGFIKWKLLAGTPCATCLVSSLSPPTSCCHRIHMCYMPSKLFVSITNIILP